MRHLKRFSIFPLFAVVREPQGSGVSIGKSPNRIHGCKYTWRKGSCPRSSGFFSKKFPEFPTPAESGPEIPAGFDDARRVEFEAGPG